MTKQEAVARELLRIFQDDGMYDRGEWEDFAPDTHSFIWSYAGRILDAIDRNAFEAAQRPVSEANRPKSLEASK